FLSSKRNNQTGKLQLVQQIPNLNGKAEPVLADFETEPNDGDTVIVKNHTTGEYRCTRVHSDAQYGTSLFAAAVSSDEGNELSLEIYDGPLPPKLPEGCTAEG